jgi:PPOX class probable F420-dependent enzyme
MRFARNPIAFSTMVPDGATIDRMDLDEARDIIRTQHRAVLSTRRRDGTPQLSPVTVNVDDEGRVIISTRQNAYKVRNLRRDPRAWICVLPDTFFGTWIQVEGRATIVELPEAMEPLVDYYRRTAGEHPDWDDYRTAMERDQRVLVRIDISRAGPDRHG